MEEISGVRSAAFVMLLPAGAASETEGREGSSTVLEGLVYRGAGERDARALSDALDRLGVQRQGGAELEHTSFGGSLLADDLERALALYADIVRRPRLPESDLDAEKALALQKLEALEDNPTQKLFVHLRRRFFHGPYGRSTLGDRDAIERLTIDFLREDHAARYRPEGALLAVAGRFEWDRLRDTVATLFGDWEGAAPAVQHVPDETAQEQIGVAWSSLPVTDPNYYRSRLALQVLSGGMGARLFTEVREKRGLCYSVGAFPGNIRGAGYVQAYAGTTPERSQETLDVLLAELRRMKKGVAEEELTRARVGLLSALVMQGEASRARAAAIARDQYLLGRVRSLEEIRAEVERVDLDGLNAWLAAQPDPAFTIVTLGPRTLEMAV
ncbi:MAG: peptidase M16 [Chloroflexota bacterium]